MKEKIERKIARLRKKLEIYELGENYSDYDYTEGQIDAYESVLRIINKESA